MDNGERLRCFEADINITRIDTVYHAQQDGWQRPQAFPRHANGLILVTAGSIEYRFGNQTLVSHPGDVLKFPKGVAYSGVRRSEVNGFYVVDFETTLPGEYDEFPLPTQFTPTHGEETLKAFRRLTEIWASKGVGVQIKCKARLYDLLYELLLTADTALPEPWRMVSGAMSYMDEHLADNHLDMEEVASALFISTSQLRRIFQKTLAQSPVQYLQETRIAHAKDLLRYENRSMEEIAYLCGFSSLYYFSRLFRQLTGVSPSQYRKM